MCIGLVSQLLCACATSPPAVPDFRFDNGLWFNGDDFERRTAYVIDGALRFSRKQIEPASVIDLDGTYIVPPFCEGHNHNIGDGLDGVSEASARYLKDGVFYAMMPGSFAYYRERIAAKINTPTSVDVAFSNNGLTGTGGHPRRLREFLKGRFDKYPEFTKEMLPDTGYFEADTIEDLQAKWALIRAENPDFVKVMLLYSEEYDKRKDDPEFYGERGLDPALMPELVRLAHNDGLRVAVHVETDFDMATALRAGADIIAHTPSFSSTDRISDETIELAKEGDATLITTLSISRRFEVRSPKRYAEVMNAQRDNLTRLSRAGVNLVVGSDNFRDTSRGEARHLHRLGVLDNATLLRMWTTNCAQTVFPDRKIGLLADGYEASFVGLEGDPLADFENAYKIKIRVKDGKLLQLPH
ncbi:MAG: amidohydrolase family protein [Pseudomonadota bacterium]